MCRCLEVFKRAIFGCVKFATMSVPVQYVEELSACPLVCNYAWSPNGCTELDSEEQFVGRIHGGV